MAIYIVNTKSSNLNVRKEPNTDATIIGKLAKGTEVEASNISDGWASISFNGEQGYVSAQYLTQKSVSDSDLDSLKF
ncbi:MAG TPA: SH3 domain-containing protein [Paludibacteraceae bacterium]|jgi:mannosyl-glycoprotein endo-beta-N-acetylglucosaminidase|nr:SH3 domain-containing protein [Paludibacteraceae bacterium]HOU69401.1 SH3 domain-containing protein [Paludibacteraceae bacterium]HPH64025.1 SH3 domain-containing protein [Paludibacteraceae bacterium]HQF51128.1 SH3 domain-containing protein [Paludibacteraceae bacterium]